MQRALALFLTVLAAACGSDSEAPPNARQTEIPEAATKDLPPTPDITDGTATPNEDRVTTLGLLNKRNNLTQDIKLKSGESQRIGNVVIKVATCERTRPWETIEEEGAFVQFFVRERGSANEDPRWRKAFSGWLFRNSPSLNVVEHPVYDLWVKDCAMNFPGEEPQASASSDRAANASGSESGGAE